MLAAFRAACTRVDLAGRVASTLGDEGPFVVIAAGKAATSMLAGVRKFSRALVVIPRGFPAPPHDPRVTVIEASHPLPDEMSIHAAGAALVLASSDVPEPRLFLMSGGASSLLCAPSQGLSLPRKREIINALLHSGVSITDINIVRRHLSRIKGGALALACGDHARRTLIVSDVINGEPHDVASGPTAMDPTTIADARRIIADPLPWVETSKQRERCDVIAEPSLFAALMTEELTSRGINATVTMQEPTLRIPLDAGHGGRCTHAAAVASLTLKAGELFAAIATDGVDGSSNTSGAIVEAPLPGANEAIARFDTGNLHIEAGTAIPLEPTGLNFTDVHICIRQGIAARTS